MASEPPDSSDAGESGERPTLGRIPLKQVRMTRAELEARQAATRAGGGGSDGARGAASPPEGSRPAASNPMNSLVPYLDLFPCLEDADLARLAQVDVVVVASLRKQIQDVDQALQRWAEFLPRLQDDELARLTGAAVKTVRFWRLCQPRPETPKPRFGRATEAEPAPAPDSAAARGPTVDSTVMAVPRPGPADRAAAGAARPAAGAPAAAPAAAAAAASATTQSSAAAHLRNIAGQPFPGYDERGAEPYDPRAEAARAGLPPDDVPFEDLLKDDDEDELDFEM